MSFTEKERAFIVELTELSRKHNVTIGGCGCCGSPWVTEGDCSNLDAGYGSTTSDLQWLAPDDFEWEKYKDSIIRS